MDECRIGHGGDGGRDDRLIWRSSIITEIPRRCSVRRFISHDPATNGDCLCVGVGNIVPMSDDAFLGQSEEWLQSGSNDVTILLLFSFGLLFFIFICQSSGRQVDVLSLLSNEYLG